MRRLLVIAALALTGCQTVTVNGYDVTRGDQAAIAAGAVVVGGILLTTSGRSAPAEPEMSSPGFIECKIDINTGHCL